MAETKKADTVAVPKSNVKTEGAAPKEKNLIQGIIRGRMPIAVVAQVRFGDNKNLETKELAKLYGTTVGKIMDIKKNSTFGYLKEGFKPTKEQKIEGIDWLKRHEKYDEGAVDKLIEELEAEKEPTAEESKKFEELRIAARGQRATKKDGTPVEDAGGGNRRTAPEKAKPVIESKPVDKSKLMK